MFASTTVLFSLLASTAIAGPTKRFSCPVSADKADLPSGQTTLTIPAGEKPAYVALGVGIQNYTCTASTGKYASVGAVAELFDASCLAESQSLFNGILDDVFDAWDSNAAKPFTIQQVEGAISKSFASPLVLGQHYFVTNPFTGSGVSPVFDFRAASQKGNPNAFVLANKTGDLPAPTGAQDVDWLELTEAEGSLAKTVFRINTKAGQPPASCTPGSAEITVKYAAQYWFFN